MKSTSYEIRKEYIRLLSGQIVLSGSSAAIPVYNQQVPNGANPENYVLVSAQNATGRNTKSSFNTDSAVTLSVITRKPGNNDGRAADEIGDAIMGIVYPTPVGSVIECQSFQVTSTELVNDRTLEEYDDGQMKVIERIIIFQHKTSQII